jgi:CAAX prenyl protease-like protein
MSRIPSDTEPQAPPGEPRPRGRALLLQRHRWVTFLLPLAVYMLVGGLEPTPEETGGSAIWLAIPYSHYPTVYTLKIVLTIAAIGLVLPGYRQFPLRISPLAVAVGVAGVVIWVGLCRLGLEHRLLDPLGLGWLVELGTRPGFNPLAELQDNPAWAWGFLAIRFAGLAAVVPLVEEFFLRGFLMRFVMRAKWWEVPVGKVSPPAVLVGALLYPLLSHPAEALAAVVWFSMVTWLMLRTRNIWDCVAAHAVTNLLLGVYVVLSGQWQLM